MDDSMSLSTAEQLLGGKDIDRLIVDQVFCLQSAPDIRSGSQARTSHGLLYYPD